MKVSVLYAGFPPVLLQRHVTEGSTVGEVIELSGLLAMCREIDLNTQKVGVYGRFVKLDSTVNDGDRIEIYRKITRELDDEDDDDDDY